MKKNIFFILFISVALIYVPALNFPSFTPKWIVWALFSVILSFTVQTKIKLKPLSLLFILLVFWNILSLLWSTSKIASVNRIIFLSIALISYFPILEYIKSEKNFYKQLILLISITSFSISLTGTLQYFGLINNLFNQRTIPAAMFINKNYASPFMAFSIWWLILYLLKKKNYIISGILAFDIFYLILTATRASWIATIVALFPFIFILFITKQTNKMFSKPFAFGFLLLIILLFSTRYKPSKIEVQRNFKTQIDSLLIINKSAQVRLNIWQNSLSIISSKPVLGYGLDNFSVIYPLFHDSKVSDKYYTTKYFEGGAHNEFIQQFVETGFAGFLLLLALSLLFYVTVFKIKNQNLAYSLLLSFTALLTNSLFSSTLHYPTYFFLFMLIISITDVYSGSKVIFQINNDKLIKTTYSILLILFLYWSFHFYNSDRYFKKSNINFYKGNISFAWKYGEKAISYWRYNPQTLFNTTNYGYTLFLYDKRIKKDLIIINKLTLKALPYHFLPNFSYGLLLYENKEKKEIKKFLNKKEILLKITPKNRLDDMKKLLNTLEKII